MESKSHSHDLNSAILTNADSQQSATRARDPKARAESRPSEETQAALLQARCCKVAVKGHEEKRINYHLAGLLTLLCY